MTTSQANITVLKGDMFDSGAQCLVNTVNVVGVMGKGVALAFKQRFPEMYKEYKSRCDRGEVRLGEPYLYRTLLDPWVVNFPTKGHWRAASKLADIEAGLDYLVEHVDEWGVRSLAVPPLGCGEGGLEWRVVGPLIYDRLSRLEIPIWMYAPFTTSHHELQVEFLDEMRSHPAPPSRIPTAAIALVEIVKRLESNPYQPPIGRIFFQKLAYFATEQGLATDLRFAKGSYGPFASGLKPMTSQLVNNGLIVEEPEGSRIRVKTGPAYDRARKAYADDLAKVEPAVNHLVDLLSRMTSRQAEVAATVHLAAKDLSIENDGEPVSELDVFSAVQEWKGRREPPLTDDEMASAIRNLGVREWMKVTPSEGLPVDDDLPF